MPSIRGRGQGQDLPPFPAPPAPSDSGPPLLLQQLSLPSFLDLAPNASTPFFSDMFFSKNQKTAPPPPKIHQTLGWIDDDCCISSFGGCFEYKKSSPRFFFCENLENKKKQVFSWDLEFETNPQLLSFLVGYLCWQKCIRSQQTPLRIYGEKISLS